MDDSIYSSMWNREEESIGIATVVSHTKNPFCNCENAFSLANCVHKRLKTKYSVTSKHKDCNIVVMQ